MKIIVIKDPEGRGYTAYHADFPFIVVQEETIGEIKQKIIDIFHDIIMNSEISEQEL